MKGNKIVQAINSVNFWVARVVAFVYLAVLFIQVMDVVLRRLFNSPTIWAWDVNAQLFIGTTMLGGGYVLLRDAHVRMDVIYGRLSEKAKAICNLITFVLSGACIGLLNWKVANMAWESWKIKEHSWSLFSPPVYPLKMIFCFSVFLLLLQSIANIVTAIGILMEQNTNNKGEGIWTQAS